METKKYWTTQDGTEIEYAKLKDGHLLNILEWIKKRAKDGVQDGYYSYDDDGCGGDAWMIYGKEAKAMFDYKGLKKESERRELEY